MGKYRRHAPSEGQLSAGGRTRRIAAGLAVILLATLSVSVLSEGVAQAAATTVTPISVGHTPQGIAMSPNGATVWVANVGDNTVSAINVSSGTVTHTVTVNYGPTNLVVTASAVYVTASFSNQVQIINTSSYTVTGTVAVGTRPTGIAINPAGTTVYVANSLDTTISEINTSTLAVTTIPSSYPFAIAISPDGTTGYVSTQNSVFSAFNTTTGVVTHSISAIGGYGQNILINPAGTIAYMATEVNAGPGGPLQGEVLAINLSTFAVTSLTAGNEPTAVALSGTYLYATNQNADDDAANTVSVIDTTTNLEIRTIPVGANPYGIVLNSAGTVAYVANSGGTTVSKVSNPATATAPSVPVDETVGAQSGGAYIPFTAAETGGSPVTGYDFTTNGGVTWTPMTYTVDSSHVSPTRPTEPSIAATITGLTNGVTYAVQIRADNAVGDSAGSVAVDITPATFPNPPTAVTAVAGPASAVVSFTAPADDGGSGITSYTVVSVVDGVTATCASSPCSISGLTDGVPDTFVVYATNGVSHSLDSAPSNAVTPEATAPDAPTGVTATPGDMQASVSFAAPNDNGSAITSYTVTSTPGGLTGACAVSPCSVTRLTNGTAYAFTVHATNGVGDSPESTASNAVTPATTPDIPTVVSALAGDASASVSFTAPVDDGGSAVMSYTVTSTPDGLTASCAASPCPVTGLTNGTAYTFTVHATNGVGDSPESAASNSVTPATTPDVPTAVSATAGDGAASVSFTAPLDDGGSAITSYTVTSTPDGTTGSCAVSPCSVTGLTNGTAYTFTVHATNGLGDSPDSPASNAVTPATTPSAPTSFTATPSVTTLAVSFTAGDNGGSAVTGYQVSLDSGATWAALAATGAPLTATVTGLTAGASYQVKVRAVNNLGPGAASSMAAVTTLPAALAAPTAIAGTSSITVTWATSTDPTVTGYLVTAGSGPATCTTQTITATSCVIGAPAGVALTFLVVADSPAGDSVDSPPSAPVTAMSPLIPGNAPTSAPTTLTTTRGVLTQASPSEQITLIGTGFASYSTVTVVLYSSPVVLGTLMTDAIGAFSLPITVPADLPAGAHNFVAFGVDPAGLVSPSRMPVTVAAVVAATTSTAQLPMTGVPLRSLLLWAILCTGFGTVITVTNRTRRV